MQTSSLKVFQYNNHKISFQVSEESNGMINASHMAKCFCKRVHNFTKNEKTEEFIKVLVNRELRLQNSKKSSEKLQSSKKSFEEKNIRKRVIVKKRHGKVTYTWMNYQLALKFAAWLCPEFEVWVYDKILDLIQNGSTQLDTKPTTTAPKEETSSEWFNRMEDLIKGKKITRRKATTSTTGPITNNRLKTIHNELDSHFKLWQAQDAAQREINERETGYHTLVNEFFSEFNHFKFGDAFMMLPSILEGMKSMGFKHERFYGIDTEMNEEEARKCVVFLQQLNVYRNRQVRK